MPLLNSSVLSRAEYDSPLGQLTIWFHGGDVYVYHGVPEYVYTRLISSSSPGSYYNDYIKRKYS